MGLSVAWTTDGGKHIPYSDGRRLTGTPRYTSINTHKGIEQTRRDDLESLGYMLLYFCIGRLPWQGTKGETKMDMYTKIGSKKQAIALNSLCKDAPPQLKEFIRITRALKFDEK